MNIPYYRETGLVDINVLFAPTDDAIKHFTSIEAGPNQLNKLANEVFCRLQCAKFIASGNQSPVVFAFFSPTAPEEISVEEVTHLKVGGHIIERTLGFAPEYYQASVGLLSYFGEILRQKDPNTKAKVRIEQDGNLVRLHIESPSGEIETIEKELEQYALIVNSQAPPESLLDNPGQIIQLKAQLRIAQMQVETAHDLRQLSDGRIASLEKQVEFLQTQFAAQVTQKDKVIDLATRQNDSHERMQTALLAHSQTIFQDLLRQASGNQQLVEAVSSLQRNRMQRILNVDVEDKLDRALTTVKRENSGFLSQILSSFNGAVHEASASATVAWVVNWIAQNG